MPGPVGFAPVATAALVGAVRPDNSTCTVDENGILTISHTGTVTSIALTAPAILSVAGSPITTAGTLVLSLATQAIHLAWLGPLSGAPAAPTFRAIDYTDLPVFNGPGAPGIVPDSTGQEGSYLRADGSWAAPSGATSGTVTSVALSAPGILAVGGSPITSAGTLALTLATQAAHAAWLGPLSGSAAAPTFRAIGATDLPTFGGPGVLGIVPDSTGHTGQFLQADGTWATPEGTSSGSVTTFSATVPGEFAAEVNNPTTTPHLIITKATQDTHLAWLGPLSGPPAVPTFRAIDYTDLPVFNGPGAPGIVPDSTGQEGSYLRADGSWDAPSGTAFNLQVQHGATTASSVNLLKFTTGATVTDAGSGEADVAIINQGIEVSDGTHDQSGTLKLTFELATLVLSAPNATHVPNTFTGVGGAGVVPDPGAATGKFLRDDASWSTPGTGPAYVLEVTGGGGDVTPVSTIHFSSHATISDGGDGIADVAIAWPGVFSGAGAAGLVPDPGTEHGHYLDDHGAWSAPSGGSAYVLEVVGGGGDVTPVSKLNFTTHATVSDGMDGMADIAVHWPAAFAGAGAAGLVPDPGTEHGHYLDDHGAWSTPADTVLNLHVADDSGSHANVSTIVFTAGADVTAPSAGEVHVAISNAGITVVAGDDTQTNVQQVTVVGAALTGSSPDVTLTIDTATALTVSDGSSGIHPATTIAFTEGIEMTQPVAGTAAIAVRGIGMEVSDGTHDEAGVFSLVFPVTTVTFDNHTATVVPATFDGPGVPGMVPDPTSSSGRFLRDDATWQPSTTGYPALSAFMVTLAAPFEYDLPTGGWQNVGTAGMGATLVAGTWFLLLSLQVEAPGRTAGDTLPSWNIRLWDDTNNAELASGSVALGVDTPFYATVTCMCMIPLTAAANIVAQMRVSATAESGSIRVASALGSVGASRLWGQRMS